MVGVLAVGFMMSVPIAACLDVKVSQMRQHIILLALSLQDCAALLEHVGLSAYL